MNTLFFKLLTAQLNTVQPCVDSYLDFTGSDDRWDYLRGALALASDMLEMEEPDDKQLLALLNLKVWENYACDGIANEIWTWMESLGHGSEWYEDVPDDFIFTSLDFTIPTED